MINANVRLWKNELFLMQEYIICSFQVISACQHPIVPPTMDMFLSLLQDREILKYERVPKAFRGLMTHFYTLQCYEKLG